MTISWEPLRSGGLSVDGVAQGATGVIRNALGYSKKGTQEVFNKLYWDLAKKMIPHLPKADPDLRMLDPAIARELYALEAHFQRNHRSERFWTPKDASLDITYAECLADNKVMLEPGIAAAPEQTGWINGEQSWAGGGPYLRVYFGGYMVCVRNAIEARFSSDSSIGLQTDQFSVFFPNQTIISGKLKSGSVHLITGGQTREVGLSKEGSIPTRTFLAQVVAPIVMRDFGWVGKTMEEHVFGLKRIYGMDEEWITHQNALKQARLDLYDAEDCGIF